MYFNMQLGICNLCISIDNVYICTYTFVVVYNVHVISQNFYGRATEADGGASAPVGPSKTTPLVNAKPIMKWAMMASLSICDKTLHNCYFNTFE